MLQYMSANQLPPISVPAGWNRQQLMASQDWHQRWTADELNELREAVNVYAKTDEATPTPRPDTLGLVCDRARSIQGSLEQGCGATLLSGLDLSCFTDSQAKVLFQLVAQKIGTAVSQSATGEKVFSVQDSGYASTDRRARGPNTRKRLSFHTDRCDVIAFLCVRQAVEGGENDVISSVTLYNRIREQRPDLCQTLMQPFYYMRHNVDHANSLPYCRQPVFSIHEGHFAANILRVLIERAHSLPDLPDLTRRQREALDFLEQTAEDQSLYNRFLMRPGDMLFLNNWVTFHRRTEFVDDDDPSKKRLLYRAWLSVPNSRPIDSSFADNYGATAAGAIRGGMKSAR